MPARKGSQPRNAPRGRPAGTHNLVTRSAKEAFEFAFKGLGGAPGLLAWAKKNQRNRTEFYKIFAKHFLPTTLKVEATLAPLPDVVVTVEQASQVYHRVMDDPALDISQITFAPPSARTSADNTPQTGDLSQPHPDSGYSAPAVDVAFTEVPAPSEPSNVVELSERQRLWAKLSQ
jgi:hypothetical protein